MTDAPVDLLAVGEAVIDFLAPDAPDLLTAGNFIRAAGGAPANVAVAAARLGIRSAFAGAVGADPFGRHLREVLLDNDVDISGLQALRESTTLAFVARNFGGIPDFVFYRGADAAYSAQMLPLELIASAKFVYVSSLALLTEPSRGATLAAVMHAREAGALVVFDPNIRPSSWPSIGEARDAVLSVARRIDILKINEEEAALLTGNADLDRALRTLSTTGRLLVVTRGPQGCLWSWRGGNGSISAPEVKALDTTGAGDAFTGGLIAALCLRGYRSNRFWALRRDHLEDALRFACAAGALACTAPGVIPSLPTCAQVEEVLGSEP